MNLYLAAFNLGPLHLLGGLEEDMFNLRRKEYRYRKTAGGQISNYVK